LALRFRSTGREHVPATGPVLLVSNHQSYLDPVLVGVACPRQLRSLARHSLFFWPLSWLIRSIGAVPIDRDRGGLGGIKSALKILDGGEALLVFPEGTRTKDGRLQPLMPGFCALARRSGATIVPVAINGAFAAMPRGSLFPRPHPITLTFCPPILSDEQQRLGDTELAELVSRRIAAALSTVTVQ
jgi:1-acyl-sn-glycerol-3-phosphate acyltransferase